MLLKVFFSWQMETDIQGLKMKGFLKNCIQSAINKISNKGELKNIALQLYEGLNRVPGNVDVAQEMFHQIDECDIFIGDFTVVQKICKTAKRVLNKKGLYFRYTPNCNVYGEYNRALGKSDNFCRQIILLMNTVNGDPHQDTMIIPFDTRGRRFPITFELKNNNKESEDAAKTELMKVLPMALGASAKAAMEDLKRKYHPFNSRLAQKKDNRLNFSLFVDVYIDKYRKQIESNKGVLRVVGPKGYNKTILVYRVFDNSDKENNYLYCNYSDTTSERFKSTLERILEKEKELVLVVDRCPNDIVGYMLEQNKRFGSNNSLIAIVDKDNSISSFFDYQLQSIDLSTDMQEEVKKSIQDAGVKSVVQLEAIKNFCQDNPQLIQLIANEISSVGSDFYPTSETLTTKLLGYLPQSDERKIMQALAMFEFVGWTMERNVELLSILENKDIVSVNMNSEVLRNRAIEIIKKGLSLGYFDQKGRTVSINLQPLVEQLMTEWLQVMDSERFANILQFLNQDGNERLAKEFHDRLISIGNKETSMTLIQELCALGGPLDNKQVINTKSGSLLIEAFAQICPEIIADMLHRFLKSKDIQDIRQMELGRRNLVWTLGKLCFISETFEKSAESLLLLAIAENEVYANNATGQFLSLFPLVLPDTEVNLGIRLLFLQRMITIPEYKDLVVRAIGRATHTRDYMRMEGNEKCGNKIRQSYLPVSPEECRDYIKGCIDILKEEIDGDSGAKVQAETVLEKNCAILCDSGYADIVLPVIRSVAERKDGNWDEMYKSLTIFRNQLSSKMDKVCKGEYESLLNYLKKMDVVSRFVRIESESFYGNSLNKFEERQQIQKNEYKTLAEEVYKKNLLTDENLKGWMCADIINSTPFGETLACLMTDEEQKDFITKFVSIANETEIAKPSILIEFISKVSEDVFKFTLDVLKNCRISYVLFACMARRSVLPSTPLFDELIELIVNGKAKVSDFQQYWINFQNNLMTEEMVFDFFSRVLQFDESFDVVVHMSMFLRFNGILESYSKVVDLLEKAYLKNTNEVTPITNNTQTHDLLNRLLANGERKELAKRVNRQIICLAASVSTYFSPGYELESMYVLLMRKYFAEIWPDLSNALLSDNEKFMTYFNLKNLLGCNIVDNHKPFILEGDHFNEMLNWCDKNKETAPARLAGMINVAENGQFTKEAITMIDKYADQPYVLNEIGCSLDSFASVGSVVPYYEERAKIYETLLRHKNAKVRQWAQQQYNNCKYFSQNEINREAEKL